MKSSVVELRRFIDLISSRGMGRMTDIRVEGSSAPAAKFHDGR